VRLFLVDATAAEIAEFDRWRRLVIGGIKEALYSGDHARLQAELVAAADRLAERIPRISRLHFLCCIRQDALALRLLANDPSPGPVPLD
jgi:hypothetical protein